ncbi:mitochondrial outer membrane translocase complex, subunit Tom5 [Usnea florida]
MFGGPQAPPSKAELKAAEDEAFQTVKQVAAASILLYLSPFVVDYVKKLV